jgi:hypothetical protein
MSIVQPVRIPFPQATADETVLGVAVVYGRTVFGVQVAPTRLPLAGQTIGTWTITVQGSNNPAARSFNMQGNPIDLPGNDEQWFDLGTIAQTDVSHIKWFTNGPIWAVRLKVTAISGYTSGDLVAWVV